MAKNDQKTINIEVAVVVVAVAGPLTSDLTAKAISMHFRSARKTWRSMINYDTPCLFRYRFFKNLAVVAVVVVVVVVVVVAGPLTLDLTVKAVSMHFRSARKAWRSMINYDTPCLFRYRLFKNLAVVAVVVVVVVVVVAGPLTLDLTVKALSLNIKKSFLNMKSLVQTISANGCLINFTTLK